MDMEQIDKLYKNNVFVKESGTNNKASVYQFVKRIIDITLSVIGLMIGMPIMIVFGIAVKLESKGPLLYRQERLGKDGKPFIMYKIRSMFIDAERDGPKIANKQDDRITRVGSFIRRARIDELPQFFNILKGDMSIVGPRPEREIFTYIFNERVPGFIDRLRVKPGLTGWAQVNGGYDIMPEEKLRLDMEYMQNMSILKDLKIVCKTVVVILTGYGSQ